MSFLTDVLLFSSLVFPQQAPGVVDVPPAPVVDSTWAVRSVLIGSVEDDRQRLAHLFGIYPADGYLLRSASSLTGWREGPAQGGVGEEAGGGLRLALLPPEFHGIWNSDLPHSLNEGALWAGRGASGRTALGFAASYRNVTLIVAPEYFYEENRPFQTVSFPGSEAATRHPLASPFHYPPGSVDLPQRFGYEPRRYWHPGQSSLTVRIRGVALGASTENLWWGPGIRNALVMSNHAPGIPHLFLATSRPLTIPGGQIEGRWILGGLLESEYFDLDGGNDHRSLSALALTFSPFFDPGLTLGAARAVYAPSDDELIPFGAAFDVFRSVGRPFHAPGDTLIVSGPDQLFSLFARWVFPPAGFEVYGEWGKYEQPGGLRDLLEVANHSRGYTVGFQWARPLGSALVLRIQSEITNLEPSTSYRIRPFGEWYASRAVPQGYTHEGRVIGASIGPSGSSQWLAADLFGDRWTAGVILSRIRWENQARYTYPAEFRRSDVSLIAGLRTSVELGFMRISAEYVRTGRLNYLFQSQPISSTDDRGVDIPNNTLRFTLSTGRVFRPSSLPAGRAPQERTDTQR